MKNKSKQVDLWIEQYYGMLYKYLCRFCEDRPTVEGILQTIFTLAHREQIWLKPEADTKAWMLQASHYFLLLEISESCKRGEPLENRFQKCESLNLDRLEEILESYRECIQQGKKDEGRLEQKSDRHSHGEKSGLRSTVRNVLGVLLQK